MKQKIKKHNPKIRATTWKYVDVVVALTPLVVLAIIQFDEYFGTKTSGFSNVIGISLLGVFFGSIIAKKTSWIKGIGGYLVVFLIAWFMRAILNDLVLISGAALLGASISKAWTNPKKIKWEKIRDKKETADINAAAMEEVVSTIIARSGRV